MAKPSLPPALLLLWLAAAACGRPSPSGVEIPLLDGDHAPDVLAESRRLAMPPAAEGNRFLGGWEPRLCGDALCLEPGSGGSRLEVVNLEARPRELVVEGTILNGAGGEVRVRVAGEDADSIPLVFPLEISLPARSLRGRFPVDLDFPAGAEIAVERAGIRQALAAGAVRRVRGGLSQAGWSLVDFVRPVPAGSRLLGRFVPPKSPEAGQRFIVSIEREGAPPDTAFEWRGGWWSRALGVRELDVALGPEDGAAPELVRIRLLATGEGSAALWLDLRLRLPAAALPESAPLAEPPAAPRLVVLYTLDALRADHVGPFGAGPGRTPHLDRLASEGVVFTRHLSAAPNTSPSLKALFTGVVTRVENQLQLAADGPETLAELFSGAGYRTGAFSANPYVSTTYGLLRGFDNGDEGQIDFDPWDDRRTNDSAEQVHAAALAWLDRLAADDRAFVYLHSLNPHSPYTPPAPFGIDPAGAGGNSRIDGTTGTLLAIRDGELAVDAADERRIRELYASGVAYNDARIGALVGELERRYAPGEVLLIVTSDHGEELFDHDGVLHGLTLYREQLHVPLVFWWPTRLSPARVDAATDHLDLHQTLRALAGAPLSAAGADTLWPLLLSPGGERRGKPIRFAAAPSLRGAFLARSERYKLIWAPRFGGRWGLGEGRGRSRDPEYLFDLVEDPGETVNLAGAEESLEVAWLRSRLLAWVARGREIEAGAAVEPPVVDEKTRAKLRALGYLD